VEPFEGYQAAQACLPRFEHDPHASLANRFQDFVTGMQAGRGVAWAHRNRGPAHYRKQGVFRKRFQDLAAAITTGDMFFNSRPCVIIE
jgi:hypothetical protein